MGCHALLQGISPTQGSNPGLPHCRQILYCLSYQGSPKILEWVAYPFSRFSWPRNPTGVSCIAGGFCAIWATPEALVQEYIFLKSTLILFGRKQRGYSSSSPFVDRETEAQNVQPQVTQRFLAWGADIGTTSIRIAEQSCWWLCSSFPLFQMPLQKRHYFLMSSYPEPWFYPILQTRSDFWLVHQGYTVFIWSCWCIYTLHTVLRSTAEGAAGL